MVGNPADGTATTMIVSDFVRAMGFFFLLPLLFFLLS